MVGFRSVELGDSKPSASLFSLFGIHLFRHVSSDWGGHSPRQCFRGQEPRPAVRGHDSDGILSCPWIVLRVAGPGSVFLGSRAFLAGSRHFAGVRYPKQYDGQGAGAVESCSDPAYLRILHCLPLHAYRPAAHRDVVLAPLEANVDFPVRYDCLLIVSILLLEWHYLVDIIGGIFVAGIAIAITDNGLVKPLVSERL